ncbi:MAG: hypothetical protein QXE98_05665, partial [Archaeoglobaceae archaeon]
MAWAQTGGRCSGFCFAQPEKSCGGGFGVRVILAAIKEYLRDKRASLGSIVTMALGFAVLVTVVMVTNFIGVSIFNAIQPQIGTISDTNVSKAVNSTTWGTF